MSRKTLYISAFLIGGFFLLQMIVGSRPFQKYLIGQVSEALSTFGLTVKIESIEFSLLTAKAYLNRVTIEATETAPVQFKVPISIDKIKLQISPIALIFRKILITDASLFNPKILIPNADVLYSRIKKMVEQTKPVQFEKGKFEVLVKKVGVIDAIFNVVVHDPDIAVRSQSLTAFLHVEAGSQNEILVQARDLEVTRKGVLTDFQNVDINLDLSASSIRLNRMLITSGGLDINITGTSSLPTEKNKIPEAINLSYQVVLPLNLLNSVQELSLPEFEGEARAEGTLKLVKGKYSGSGRVHYQSVSIDGYGIDTGEFQYVLQEQQARIQNMLLNYSGGSIRSSDLTIKLQGNFPVLGTIELDKVSFRNVLKNVKSPDSPVEFLASGVAGVEGQIIDSFNIKLGLKEVLLQNLEVVENANSPANEDNTIIKIAESKATTDLVFYSDRLEIKGGIDTLGGKLNAEGVLEFSANAKFVFNGKGLSLFSLKEISSLHMGGIADLSGTLEASDLGAKVLGTLSVAKAEVGGVVLGDVQGKAQYENDLLSFEELTILTSLEPIKGNGYVDFGPAKTHYRFDASARRVKMERSFEVLSNLSLDFERPTRGELSIGVQVEGGHDDLGIDVKASGVGKKFVWHGETWLSGQFDLRYRPSKMRFTKLLLTKPSGALEVKAEFLDKSSSLHLFSRGLRLEELDHVGSAPVSGMVEGDLLLSGNLSRPEVQGNVFIRQSDFRGVKLADSEFKVSTKSKKVEVLISIAGENLRGRWERTLEGQDQWEVLVYFSDFDFSPLLAIAFEKNIPSLSMFTATGDLRLKGKFEGWTKVDGSGSIASLRIGTGDSPLVNQEPISLLVERGSWKVSPMNLVGRDSQLNFELDYEPGEKIQSSLDGKIDLQVVQPFIPGVEYGTGKVTAGLRLSGKPNNYNLIGNVSLENGAFRLAGMYDEFRSTEIQLSVSQDKINIERFESLVNGGRLITTGDVFVNRFQQLIPNLRLSATGVTLRMGDYLAGTFNGDFTLRGNQSPYLMSGKCRLLEATLSKLKIEETLKVDRDPILNFDIECVGDEKIFVNTDVLNAEFKGKFNLLGNNESVGLLGSAETLRGVMLFREKRFAISNGNVKFESRTAIAPRFNIFGTAEVKESSATSKFPQEYTVNLRAIGTAKDYKLILSSSPALAEADIISLLLLGVTSRTAEGSYVDIGTTLAAELPIQSKLEEKLGVDINLGTQKRTSLNTGTNASTVNNGTVTEVPVVTVEKKLTDTLTFQGSTSILETPPTTEVKIQKLLTDEVSGNVSFTDKAKGGSETNTEQSYGVDVRYRFQLE